MKNLKNKSNDTNKENMMKYIVRTFFKKQILKDPIQYIRKLKVEDLYCHEVINWDEIEKY